MISKTIGFRGTNHFQTYPYEEVLNPLTPRRLSSSFSSVPVQSGAMVQALSTLKVAYIPSCAEVGQTKWVCLKMVSTPTPNGFADHYPYEKWLFHWEYTLFSDKPKYMHTFKKATNGYVSIVILLITHQPY